MTAQLALSLHLRDDAIFSNFYPGENRALLTELQLAINSAPRSFYLSGSEGAGCSHLLQACCHLATQIQRTSFYLSLSNPDELMPAMLEGMEMLHVVCIDDVQGVAGTAEWEEALFHLYNRCRDNNTVLIVAGDQPPTHLSILLADLKSRLTWDLVYAVHALSDDDKILALQLRAKNRGLQLNDDVANYLITHSARSMTALYNLLDQLDKESLAQQRRLTIPFVKSVIGRYPSPMKVR